MSDDTECAIAIVHRVMTELSPLKKARRMTVCGSLTDGESYIQVVSFEPS